MMDAFEYFSYSRKRLNHALVNGRELTYADIVHHKTVTRFKFWDCLKMMFGKKVIVDSKIYINVQASVLASTAEAQVESFFPAKKIQGGLVSYADVAEKPKKKI